MDANSSNRAETRSDTRQRAYGDRVATARTHPALGIVFSKALRDSRRAFLIEVLALCGFLFLMFPAFVGAYPTPASRDELARLAAALGSTGAVLVGPIVDVATAGGYIGYRYGPVMVIVAGLWSILSLTATLAGEADRGSLDVVVASPIGKRRVAIEKAAAHVALLAATMTGVAFAAWAGGALFPGLPGDEIPPAAAVGFALWVGTVALTFGGLGLALSQVLGRAAGAWIAGALLVAGPILINERSAIPTFEVIHQLTPWWWTWGQASVLAGRADWVSLGPVALLAGSLLAAGIEAFGRRDIGAPSAVSIRLPRLASPAFGVGGPFDRSFAERLPLGLAWGLGLGGLASVMAHAARSMADETTRSASLLETLGRVFPTLDLTTVQGWLQLSLQLLLVLIGMAAATFVAGWASEESSGRLEILLAAPLSRSRWFVLSGLGVIAAIALSTGILALALGVGVASGGGDAVTAMTGTVVLGLFAAALAGVGFAVGGVIHPSLAAWAVVAVLVATELVDLAGPAVGLPTVVRQVALTSHLGQPLAGAWDWPGTVACVVFALGGLAIGARGLARRDLRR